MAYMSPIFSRHEKFPHKLFYYLIIFLNTNL